MYSRQHASQVRKKVKFGRKVEPQRHKGTQSLGATSRLCAIVAQEIKFLSQKLSALSFR
jgi:hypothetical protein